MDDVTNGEIKQLRCAVDVVVGVLPGTPMSEFTRRFFVTSEDWNAEGADQSVLLSDMAGKASAWATLHMLQPQAFNWVKLEWIWF